MKNIQIRALISMFLICILLVWTSSSCMNRKRCPGVHRYTTQGGAGLKDRDKKALVLLIIVMVAHQKENIVLRDMVALLLKTVDSKVQV